VIDAINTKPYGNLYFYPGPGVGGHCIPVDPLYLQWKAQQIGSDFEFIAVAKKVNDRMPDYIVSRLARLLGGTSLQGRSIFVVGVAYKKDVNDIRESSAMAIMESLIEQGARVVYHDPHVPHVTINGERYDSAELTDETIRAADCVLLLVDHSNVPIDALVSGARLLFDTRNATGRFGELPHVIRL
jgi:UDP-N-acetyl-D-glucosamine dehydrogenase